MIFSSEGPFGQVPSNWGELAVGRSLEDWIDLRTNQGGELGGIDVGGGAWCFFVCAGLLWLRLADPSVPILCCGGKGLYWSSRSSESPYKPLGVKNAYCKGFSRPALLDWVIVGGVGVYCCKLPAVFFGAFVSLPFKGGLARVVMFMAGAPFHC